jgi:hypothetical protein
MNGRRVTLCFKLMGSFAALLVMLAVLSLCALLGIRSLAGSLDTAVNSTAKKMEMAAAIDSGVHEMRVHAALAEISLLSNMIRGVPGSSGDDAGCSACHTPDRVDANRATFVAIGRRLAQQATTMHTLVHSTVEQKSLDTVQAGIANWELLYGKYLDMAAHQDFSQAHNIMVDQIYPILPKIDEAAEALNAEQLRLLAESRAAAHRQVSLGFWEVSLAVAFGLPAGIAGLWVVRQVAGSLRRSTSQLLEMSQQVASAAGQIAQSNQSLAQGVSRDTAELVSASVDAGHTGRTQLDAVAAVIGSITERTLKVKQLIDQVNQTGQEQAQGLAQISGAMAQMDQVTTMTAANAEQRAAASGQLSAQSQAMRDVVASLQTMV